MEIVVPQFGLFFWTLVIFLTFFLLLRKYAWKPILKMIHEREESIESSLQAAEQARLDMQRVTADNEKFLSQARSERDSILREAQAIREKMIAEAKMEANKEASKLLEDAKRQIQLEKVGAIAEIKNQAASLAVDIAEKILRKELENKDQRRQLAHSLIADLKVN